MKLTDRIESVISMVNWLRRAVDRESGVAEAQTGTQTSRALLTELAETTHRHAAL